MSGALRHLARLQHGVVSVVVFDNTVKASAHAVIGFAMGATGADIAMEAADIVIMNDDLHRIATTVRLSRKTHVVLWQNIALAIVIKLVFFYLAIFDDATMWMAVFADMGASLLVVANGLRLLHGDHAPTSATTATEFVRSRSSAA